ncbi:hypothetical protein CMI37_37235 [Candidatus Pacearchaeota archaeon]|nr:hypothetical protein [Candidatus Pacearchaeota archaeon]
MVKIKQPRQKGRRITPPDEIDRINERLFRESKLKIQDRDSYDLAFNDILSISDATITSGQKRLRDDAFSAYRGEHPEVSAERLFTEAKGRDLRRDRLKTAKKVVKTRKGFIKEKATEVDLKGFDTARQRVTKEILRRRTFTVPARAKGRIVFAMKTSVVVKGKSVVRHRDSKGRFVSAKSK